MKFFVFALISKLIDLLSFDIPGNISYTSSLRCCFKQCMNLQQTFWNIPLKTGDVELGAAWLQYL